MANNIYIWSYLLFALLVLFMVLQQMALKEVVNQYASTDQKGKAIIGISQNENRIDHEQVNIPTEADKSSALRNELQKIFRAEVGVRELNGKNDGKRVEEYLAVTNLGKGHAWCASFISWTFAEAGLKEPNTPWSPALFPKNRLIWTQKHPTTDTEPTKGDVFGIWFPGLERIAHAGFVDEWGTPFIVTVEGNTNEAGNAEGDGVYRRRRPIRSIHSVANWVDKPSGRIE